MEKLGKTAIAGTIGEKLSYLRNKKTWREFERVKSGLAGTTVEITMDGNRRAEQKFGWAEGMGHMQGAENASELTRFLLSNDINVVLWGFSTDNWKRSDKEIGNIFNITTKTILKSLDELHENGVRIMQLGRRDRYPQHLRDAVREAEARTFFNKGPVLQLALDFGGRDETERSLRRIEFAKKHGALAPDTTADFQLIKAFSDDGGMLFEIDIALRFGNVQRTSAFGDRIDYSEHRFLEEPLPKAKPVTVAKTLVDFSKTERRFGGDSKKR